MAGNGAGGATATEERKDREPEVDESPRAANQGDGKAGRAKVSNYDIVSHYFDVAEEISPEELMAIECEVFIPAALGRMIHAENAESLNAKMIIEGGIERVLEAAQTRGYV